MPSSLRWRVPLALAAVALALWHTFPLSERINLGLDLQGGMHLVLKVDTAQAPPEARETDITTVALEIIRNRIDQFGVREPLIQRQGGDRILVQLPGVTDRERALKLIGQTALLEFELVSDNQRLIQRALDGEVPPAFALAEDAAGAPYLLETDPTLTGSILADADVTPGDFGLPEVRFWLTREGARQFGRLTGANVGRRLAIVLDGVVQSAPEIQSRITDQGRITGRFTSQEAHDLAIVLRAGALPAPIMVEEERTVGPTLGRDSIRAGLVAIGVGMALIVAFMVGYYLLAGVVAVLALALNLLFILGGLGYLQATLTLPGIAGIILTLGMAVDANILIYERIREELRGGRPLSLAIAAGYEKAFSAILDSNLTTLIAAGFLWGFGTGPLRGFATTLSIGLTASLFTAIFVTRIIFDALLGAGRLSRLRMLRLGGDTRWDFIGKRRLCYGLSALLVAAGTAAFVLRGSDRYGIDFTGGLLQEYRFAQPVSADGLRASLATVGLGDAVIQQFGAPTEWLIRTPVASEGKIEATTARTRQAFQAEYAQAAPELVRLERVGPTVGTILRKKAWMAIGWSLLGILGYVAVRFRHLDFGAAAVIALIHDVVVGAGALCLVGRQIDFTVVAALMTIAGYSVNDTIVIYDRVRENLHAAAKRPDLAAIINASVNQTLSRTVLTSLTTLLGTVSLYLFGGEVLRDFALCLIVGFVSGVYSTVYIASALVVTWRRLFAR
jgi:SecD/SecF fusion protein